MSGNPDPTGADIENPSRIHLPALDGIRRIAVLVVIALHTSTIFEGHGAWLDALRGICKYGYLGVDLFFVLSGFLISGILIDNRAAAMERGQGAAGGYFRVFYWRRILRIFPAYYVYLAVIFLIQLIGTRLHLAAGWRPNYAWYVTYLQNLQPGNGGDDYYLTHLWSLAVEEQFYIFWPLVVWLLPPRWLGWACAGLACSAVLARHVLWNPAEVSVTWRLTPCRLDSLCLGALMAVWFRSEKARALCIERGGILLVMACAAVVFLAAEPQAFPYSQPGFAAAAVFFSGAVFWAAVRQPKLFRQKWIRQIGKYSYAMYLYHLLPHLLVIGKVNQMLTRVPPSVGVLLRLLYVPAMMAVTLGLALVSWELVEHPFLRFKNRYTYIPLKRTRGAFASQ